MSIENIFKASLLFLTLVVLFVLDIETEVLYLILSTGMFAYTVYAYLIYRDKMREKQERILVVKSSNWIPALLMWGVVAAMVLKNQSGALLYVNAALLTSIAVLTALRETTNAYVIDRTGIQVIKSAKFIAADEIVNVLHSDDAIMVLTKSQENRLTIPKRKLKSPDLDHALALLTSFPKVLKEV